MNSQTYNRLIEEQEELKTKLDNLYKFIKENRESNKVSKKNMELLEEQFNVMISYCNILDVRIELNKP